MAKFGKDYKEVASTVLQCTLASYYNWANQKRPVISLLEKYFTKEDLEEFIQTGRISKFEILEDFKMLLQGSKLDYLSFVTNHLKHSKKFDFFTDFYYRFLVYIDEIRHSPKESDIEYQNIFQLNDALPSFLINNSFTHLNEIEMHQLQNKIRLINGMDQNTTNLILLSISNDFQSLIQQTNGQISDAFRKDGVIHSLMFCIYKYHPTLDYGEKIKLLSKVLGTDESTVFEVFEKITWKMIEAEYGKTVDSIKTYK